ncbi:PAS domain-containing protein [Palleronia pelagia]|uniref:histidine kinase n=1 Tax=Palleronia pelagia TaxID=387096 RepID=A0A1H8DS56_9RHOB|nr:PAS domain-containing protein [Palleronia pelagia]SEN09996.1 PAS domain S-box-containing protein [Palleronia pelagia]
MSQKSLQSNLQDNPAAMVLSDPGQEDNPLVFVNEAFEKITLYSRDAVLGKNCRFLQCDETDEAARLKLREAIEAGRDVTADLINEKADGTRFLNRVVIAPLRGEDGKIHSFLGIQSEIPGEEDDQNTSIDDRSAQMLRELQHRVKNHLSMVVGLIRLQSRKAVTRESFEALSHRVQTLALLYEELSPAGIVDRTAETLPAGAYLSRVANTIAAIDGRNSIRVNVECDEIELPVETGARLGMLLNEFITNALEHAFTGRDEGVVQVRLNRMTRGKLRLTVEDDGIGLPDGFDWPHGAPSVETRKEEATDPAGDGQTLNTRGGKRKSGLGASIVKAMVDHLDGDLTVSASKHGTIVTVDLMAPA